MDLPQKIEQAVTAIRGFCDLTPDAGVILGSGLGKLADEVQRATAIPYEKIPHFAASTVPGHVGELILGELQGRTVAVMRGRLHYYEGYSMGEITFPVRVMKALGAQTMLVTNACGGLNANFIPGDLMLISDHLNLMGDNPLIGRNHESLGPRFPPMSRAYDVELRRLVRRLACENGIHLHEGVYCALTGPSFETPAEIRYFDRIGADAVGMSTVPEVIVANHSGMRVVGISCVTNVLHEGPSNDTHEDVLEAANSASPKLMTLARGILENLPR